MRLRRAEPLLIHAERRGPFPTSIRIQDSEPHSYASTASAREPFSPQISMRGGPTSDRSRLPSFLSGDGEVSTEHCPGTNLSSLEANMPFFHFGLTATCMASPARKAQVPMYCNALLLGCVVLHVALGVRGGSIVFGASRVWGCRGSSEFFLVGILLHFNHGFVVQ